MHTRGHVGSCHSRNPTGPVVGLTLTFSFSGTGFRSFIIIRRLPIEPALSLYEGGLFPMMSICDVLCAYDFVRLSPSQLVWSGYACVCVWWIDTIGTALTACASDSRAPCLPISYSGCRWRVHAKACERVVRRERRSRAPTWKSPWLMGKFESIS